jgi:hypothetical protein
MLSKRSIRKRAADVRAEVARFLFENPSPNDETFHKWAESSGFDVHEAEAQAYFWASVTTRFLLSGRSKEKNFDESKADPKQFVLGTRTEKEHCSGSDEITDLITRKITLDHLVENDKCYQVSDVKKDVLMLPVGGD